MTDFRTEKDSVGNIKVPANKYWGAQTQKVLKILKLVKKRCQKF